MAVYWITGLSGVGKTTVAELLVQRLRQQGKASILLDGDAVRAAIADEQVGYDIESRLTNARRMCRLAAMFAEQDLHVVVATISLFHEIHAWNRQHFRDYLEIWLTGKIDKQLNQREADEHRSGPVVGIDILPEFPQDHHLSIENSGISEDLPRIVDQILQTAQQCGIHVR